MIERPEIKSQMGKDLLQCTVSAIQNPGWMEPQGGARDAAKCRTHYTICNREDPYYYLQ